ncbi:uncharacterized protein LOC124896152 [Capsicum annuum]|uniref:uncharacterized protein LOC124896152 n=1 Tax=Capsicum annuum TaxID=4072 RepID=UPI001FB12D2D|nr:uncharacterized protein LOC124896152 [Capsicum annuum]
MAILGNSSEATIKKQWQIKAAIVYRNFIAKIKEKGIRQGFIHEDVWESWQRLWADPKCVEKSKINAQNHRGGKEVAAGTHTGGSISTGEYRKRLERFEEILREKTLAESVIDQIEAYYQAAGGQKK